MYEEICNNFNFYSSFNTFYFLFIAQNSIERPQYPKSQYTTHRAHISMDPTLSQNSIGHSHTNSVPQTPENPYGYDSYR